MEIRKTPFGTLSDGREVSIFTMKSDELTVSVLDYGCTIQSIIVADKLGKQTDVVLGYNNPQQYQMQDTYFGVTAGRYANRIAKGEFTLLKRKYKLACNDKGKNHLHGGVIGFDKRMWTGSIQGDKLTFSLVSDDGDEGYPGRVEVTADYTIKRRTLAIEYTATTDKTTILNLTNHSYFNLNGEASGDVLGHTLLLNASRVVLTDSESIPTGVILPVQGSCFDFTRERAVGQRITDAMMADSKGYDHCYLLDNQQVGKLVGEKSGIIMDVKTSKPAVQLYCGNFIDEIQGKSIYHKHAGLCLETQYMPDSPNQKDFSNCVLNKGETYKHRTEFCFTTL